MKKEYLFKQKKFSFRDIVDEPLKPIPEFPIKLINNSIINNNEIKTIYEILNKYKIFNHIIGYEYYQIEYSNNLAVSCSIVDAHGIYTKKSFHLAEKLSYLPHQKDDAVCSENINLIRILCIKKFTPSMGSWWGFNGYALGLLVDTKKCEIFDARGYNAT
jgi:hypothetical protein